MRRSSLLIISLLIVGAGGLQAQQNSAIPESKEGNSFFDKLVADLNKKIPETRNIDIAWRSTRLGYFTRYTIDNIEYMSMYDKQGAYKATLEKKPWDDRIPENIRMEFYNSPYNTCSVLTFWESIQTYNKDFYLELMEKDGKSRSAWFDENGKFSEQPSFYR